jgi:galactose-1-phosphate uridylyltransferase
VSQHLSRKLLAKILQTPNVEQLSGSQLARLFRQEPGITTFIPDGVCQIDPRNGERVLYNSARSHRPHDYQPALSVPDARDLPAAEDTTGEIASSSGPCAICQGKTTGVIDVADLSAGFTFININLYPILYPSDVLTPLGTCEPKAEDPGPEGMPAHGLHFVQWTSSFHDKDWHNLPAMDRAVVMGRLAALEKQLLTTAPGMMPDNCLWGDHPGHSGFVSIIKNGGWLVGGSLAHGHQQIAFSNLMPRRSLENWRFEQRHGETFSAYMLRENPAELLVRDYGEVILMVPYFMRRPFDMLLLLKDVHKRYLHELTAAERAAVADGWHDAIRAFYVLLPEMGREIAYNVLTHNGPGAGLYFEFLPHSQETGGFERLGLAVCQANPSDAASRLRELLAQL